MDSAILCKKYGMLCVFAFHIPHWHLDLLSLWAEATSWYLWLTYRIRCRPVELNFVFLQIHQDSGFIGFWIGQWILCWLPDAFCFFKSLWILWDFTSQVVPCHGRTFRQSVAQNWLICSFHRQCHCSLLQDSPLLYIAIMVWILCPSLVMDLARVGNGLGFPCPYAHCVQGILETGNRSVSDFRLQRFQNDVKRRKSQTRIYCFQDIRRINTQLTWS